MNNKLTLDNVTPGMTFKQKVVLGLILIAVAAVLAASYFQTQINPFKLYEQRRNAFEYLFGRDITESDRETARRQAERLPRVMAYEEAQHAIQQEYRARGEKPDLVTLAAEAEKKTEEILAATPKEELDAMVKEEYERIIDEKRGGYFPPDTEPGHLKSYTLALLETMAIAVWGSLLAFLVAVPASLFAAKNTLKLMFQGESPAREGFRAVVQFSMRRFLDFCRGFNEFVMALIFVAVIGLGPFAGVIALAIHTFGILGKVFSEAIESIEPGQVEAVEASGAGPGQVIAFSVLPQVMPLIVSYSLLRFESNVRSATILGFVGAGGIGFLMFDKINGFLYREVATMMILVIISVSIIDYFCGKLRNRFT
jgi:phosphonate transport system permease protein